MKLSTGDSYATCDWHQMSDSSWQLAVGLLERFLKKPARLQHLLEKLPGDLESGSRASCQNLLYGAVRHLSLLRKAIEEFVKRKPRPGLEARLIVAAYELLEAPGKRAQIVDHAVEQVGKKFSKGERGMTNAVLRKVAERLPKLLDQQPENVQDLAWRFSHPQWLVERWTDQFGFEGAKAFLEWNQSPPPLFVRVLKGREGDGAFLEKTDWEGFFLAKDGSWKNVEAGIREGRFYIQNPATARSVDLLARRVKSGRVLDLCSAPGGKTLLLDARLNEGVEAVVSLDLPGPRIVRLKENVEKYASDRVMILEKDLTELRAEDEGKFEGVLLDAPCSNSGVIQHKIDAKWRTSPGSLKELISLQLKLLKCASRLVKPGGVLVYSTCSVDTEENEEMARRFNDTDEGGRFELLEGGTSLPWLTGCDGSGAFAFVNKAEG